LKGRSRSIVTATDDSGSENEAKDFVSSADRTIASMDRTIASMDRSIEIMRESKAMLLENRAILLAIADHWAVKIEEPDSGIQSG